MSKCKMTKTTVPTQPDYVPGTIITNHPDAKYHTAPGLSSGAIRVFARRSPLHYQKLYLNKGIIRKETDAMLQGSLVHCLVLEPNSFEQRYEKEIDPDDYPNAMRTVPELKKYCEQHRLATTGVKVELINRIIAHDPDAPVWDVMKARQLNSRKRIIKAGLWDNARRMRDGVYNNPEAANLFSKGQPEVSVWGEFEPTGQMTKCRCDWLRPDGVTIDLKTCGCASPEAFSKACADHDYAIQQVHYMQTLSSAGHPQDYFVFLAVENEEPYICQPYYLDDKSVGLSEDFYANAMEKLRACLETDTWPTYTDQTELTLPIWKLKQLEQAA